MITVSNIGQYALVMSTQRVDVQPALSGVEIAILRALAVPTQSVNVWGLAGQVGCSYPWTYAMLYRLEHRGLIQIAKSGRGLLCINALATLLEDTNV